MNNKYLIGGDVVEATLSEGRGFYTVRIEATGHEFRVLAWAFDAVAIPYVNFSDKKIAEGV